jgi:hypothetical protein
MLNDNLECLNDNNPDKPCQGPVEYRSTGRGRAFPRCDRHWTERLKLEEQINERYAPYSACPPRGFDPADAGERWDDEY